MSFFGVYDYTHRVLGFILAFFAKYFGISLPVFQTGC